MFGLVGPIGVDLDQVMASLSRSLREVGYKSEPIHLTKHIKHRKVAVKINDSTYYQRYVSRIKYANAYRRVVDNPAALAAVAIGKIRQIRTTHTKNVNIPSPRTAYIVRQFKRPEEIDLMRLAYGRKFVQVSVYASERERRETIIEKIKSYDSIPRKESVCEPQAIDLIEMDFNQSEVEEGQRVGEVFHLGDAFIPGIGRQKIEDTTTRLIDALFGDNGCSPTHDEYGMFMAAATSFRSIDLSRQVGAAIFSRQGEIVSMGCNEVPKAFGGTYWGDDSRSPKRDYELGLDPNERRCQQILYDLVERMGKAKLLSPALRNKGPVDSQVSLIRSKKQIKDSQLMDILEFGRVIHAEMSAISDAARLGRATQDAILFSTTFPCHMCAKHVVASGIRRVVFLEPYPKLCGGIAL